MSLTRQKAHTALWFVYVKPQARDTIEDFKCMVFNFSGYLFSDIEKLRKCLYLNFNLDTRFHKTGRYQQLYIPTSENHTFLDIISPYVIPSMRYRLAITP